MHHSNGFIIIDKNKGCTSHDCGKEIRKIFDMRKVGHAGTLDPEVTGILPIAIGNATRFIQYLPKTKTYSGIIKLGIKTKTDDIYGEVINKKNWPTLSHSLLDKYLDTFRGQIQQVPPKVSSVHIKGERAYKKLLRNEDFDLPAREVNVLDLTLKKWDQKNGLIHLVIKCSTGTYIRSIARDLGILLGSEGCLSYLQRLESSGFNLTNSIKIENLRKKGDNIHESIIPVIKALDHLPSFILDEIYSVSSWETGRKIEFKSKDLKFQKTLLENKAIKVLDRSNKLLGIGTLEEGEINYIQPKLVLNAK